jgi:hypothetical protein
LRPRLNESGATRRCENEAESIVAAALAARRL